MVAKCSGYLRPVLLFSRFQARCPLTLVYSRFSTTSAAATLLRT